MRKLLSILSLLVIVCSCAKHPSTETDLVHLIPQKTAAILRVPKWENLENTIQSSKFLKLLAQTNFQKSFSEKLAILKHFKPTDESYLAWVALSDDEYDLAFITKPFTSTILSDSTVAEKINTYNYEGVEISQTAIENQIIYYFTQNNILLASTSKLILENAILQTNSGRDPEDKSLKEIIKTSSASSPNIFINGLYFKNLFRNSLDYYSFQNSKPAFDWASIDLDIEPDALEFNGIVQFETNSDQSSELLANLNPGTSDITDIIPLSARNFTYLICSDWNIYKSNLAKYRSALLKEFELGLEDYMLQAKGIGALNLNDEALLISEVNDIENAYLALNSISKETELFRELPIRKFDDSTLFKSAFKELLNPPAIHYYTYWDKYFVFAKTIQELKDLIANFQNGAVLGNDPSYKNFRTHLSDTYTLEYYANTLKTTKSLSEKLKKENAKGLKELDLNSHPHAALQLSASSDYLYVNGGIYETPISQKKSQVVQIASIKLDRDLLNNPLLLKNYRTKGQNILVQDVSNTLYQINQNGKIDWKKELDGPILGKIELVDLYKNGRLQYAFVTPHHFYVIASDGKIVEPFDIDYNAQITQPLAVFDYDNNRNYRFVVIQNQDILMLDREAKNVNGFKYDKAESEIVSKPQHIRIDNKDYLLFKLKNGKLKILNRTGDSRVTVNETFSFLDQPVFVEKSNFLVIESNGTKVSISQSGKVNRSKNNTKSEILFTKKGNIEATLLDNKLKIGEIEKELDLGIYDGLQIFNINSKPYITLTDLQTNKVFIYNKSGEVLSNFPVYAASKVDLAPSGKGNNLLLICKGESDSVLIYQINK